MKVKKQNQIKNITEAREGYQEKSKSFLSGFKGYLSPVTKAYLDIVSFFK